MQGSRRDFLAGAGGAVVPAAIPVQRAPVKIGVDLYSIRLNNWTPFQYLDYLAKINVDLAHLSTVRELSPLLTDEAALKKVRAHAEKLGIGLELAMGSICPTAAEFNAKLGTAEEQVTRVLNAARIIGAPVCRAVLGSGSERRNRAIPFEAHMENTVRVLCNMRTRIVDSGVKVALENHGGDFQARELKALVEEAGRDAVSVCLDSGNPLSVVEDPHLTLETLAAYAVTSHIRDTAVWRVPEGVAVRACRAGDGNVDIAGWIKKFVQMCPGLAVSLENIESRRPQILRILDSQFWEAYPKMPAWEFSRFLAIAERGKTSSAVPPTPGKSPGEQQCEDLEASIRNIRDMLQHV